MQVFVDQARISKETKDSGFRTTTLTAPVARMGVSAWNPYDEALDLVIVHEQTASSPPVSGSFACSNFQNGSGSFYVGLSRTSRDTLALYSAYDRGTCNATIDRSTAGWKGSAQGSLYQEQNTAQHPFSVTWDLPESP